MMKYCFDLDETICATPSSRNYNDAIGIMKVCLGSSDILLWSTKMLQTNH